MSVWVYIDMCVRACAYLQSNKYTSPNNIPASPDSTFLSTTPAAPMTISSSIAVVESVLLNYI